MSDDDRLSEVARNLLEIRAIRTRFFPHAMFDEHAWEMILHLFVAHADGARLAEQGLFKVAGVEFDTGRRHLRLLVADGQATVDADSRQVMLTDRAIGRMRSFLAEAECWRTII